MHLERQEGEHNYSLVLKGTEIHALSATYRERINQLFHKGEMDSVTEFEANIGNWGDDIPNKIAVEIESPQEIASRLEEFGSATEEVTQELASGGIPHFVNRLAPRRWLLGNAALKLANDIRTSYSQASELEILKFEEQIRQVPITELPDTPILPPINSQVQE